MPRYYDDTNIGTPHSTVISSNPTSAQKAAVGDLTMNKTTKDLFVCVGVDEAGLTTWQSITDKVIQDYSGITSAVAPEGKGIIGSIYSHDSWNNNINDSHNASGPWTTYTNYLAYQDNNTIQFLNMALGDGFGRDGTSQSMFGDEGYGVSSRTLQFANGNRVGHRKNYYYTNNSTSYSGYGFRMMPIRNTSSSPISINLYSYASNYWGSGNEGMCLFVLAPTIDGVKYSQVSSVKSTLISNTNYSSNAVQQSQSGTYTVPGNTTIIVCQTSTDWYYTSYQFVDTNYFYNLNTTFSNPAIICDMRMLSSLAKSRFNMAYSGAFATPAAALWTVTAANFGDR